MGRSNSRLSPRPQRLAGRHLAFRSLGESPVGALPNRQSAASKSGSGWTGRSRVVRERGPGRQLGADDGGRRSDTRGSNFWARIVGRGVGSPTTSRSGHVARSKSPGVITRVVARGFTMVYLTNVIGSVLIDLPNRLMTPIADPCGTSGMVAAIFYDGVHDMLNARPVRQGARSSRGPQIIDSRSSTAQPSGRHQGSSTGWIRRSRRTSPPRECTRLRCNPSRRS